MMKVPGHEQT